jgi:RNA polymerase sigma-70 factor (ECF subfamily)
MSGDAGDESFASRRSRRARPAPSESRVPISPATDDADLVDAARAGNERALNQLLENNYERLYVLCRRMTGNDHDALDATQDALVAIVRGLPGYDGRAAFSTWAYRVATNACIDELRRRRRRAASSLDVNTETPEPGRPGTDQTLVDRISIDDAMAELLPEFRAAVVLRDVMGLDYAAIANVLGVPPGTVRSRIARGRRALALHIEGNPSPAGTVEEGTP